MSKYTGNLSYKSRLARQENRRFIQQTVLLIFLTIAALIFLALYGFPALLKLAVYLGNTKGSASTQQQDTIAPATPQLMTPLEATNSATLSLSGFGEPGSSIVLYQNGFKTKEITVGEDGQFTFADLTLESGDNRLFCLSRDLAGNESAETPTYTVTFTDKPPEVVLDNPKDGASFFGALQQVVTIQGHTVKNATVKLNDQLLVVGSDGHFSGRVQLSEGDNHYTLTATDPAGNSTSYEFTLKYSK